MTLQEQMEGLEKLSEVIESKQDKVEGLKNIVDKKIEKMNDQISNLQEVIEFLKAEVENICDNCNKDEQALNLEKDYKQAQEKIEKISEKVVISNKMLAKLLEKATPNVKWLIHIIEYSGFPKEIGRYTRVGHMMGLFAFSSIAHGYSVVDKERYKDAFDVTVNEPIDVKNKNFALLFEQEGTRYNNIRKEYLENFNWVEPYLIRKVTNDSDDVIFNGVKLPKGLLGDVIYEVIDKYITNLLTSKKEETKKPTIKK